LNKLNWKIKLVWRRRRRRRWRWRWRCWWIQTVLGMWDVFPLFVYCKHTLYESIYNCFNSNCNLWFSW